MTISPIPSSRVTSSLISQAQINQLQTVQQNMVQVEEQISTGQAFQYLSQNPAAGLLGVNLQEQINQQSQIGTDLTNASGAMSTTDSTLSSVSSLINSLVGTVESAQGTTATAAQKAAAASQVQDTLQQLVQLGNTKYNGQYIFAGSASATQPFTLNGDTVVYNGNSGSLNTFSDVGQVLQTNVDGNSAFGAISSPIVGNPLAPTLSLSTPLADLNGGAGVSPGSIQISDGSHTSTVDLGSAKTVGDVVNAIQSNAPAGDRVEVTLGATGLNVALINPGGGNTLAISDLGGGNTAKQLGIAGVSNSNSISGAALNPTLSLDTSLGSLLGTSASATVTSPGANNDIQITAIDHGSANNDVAISFVSDNSLPAGDVTVNYNAGAGQLTFNVGPGGATANQIVSALNASPAGSVFQASLVSGDSTSQNLAGTGQVNLAATATTAGGAGTNLDQTGGLLISSGGTNYTVNLSGAQTVQDLINDINTSGAGVTAAINSQGTGLSVTSNVSGIDFSIGENGGQTATQLGLRTFTTSTQLADLNHGLGVTTAIDQPAASSSSTLPDFQITRPDGTSFSVSVSGAQTVGDVINLINNNANNPAGADHITAQLNTTGNGIELVSGDTTSPGAFSVTATDNSSAAVDLGLIPGGQTTSAAAVTAGGQQMISGGDTNPQEVSGMFNSLAKLYTALTTGDSAQVTRTLGALQTSVTQLNYAQSELGTREQFLQSDETANSNTLTTLQSSYSKTVDTDMATAATQLTALQLDYQATIESTGYLAQTTLLNYL